MTGISVSIGYRRIWGPSERPRLTGREHQILRLVAQGMSNQDIGECLGISIRTVKNHLANTYEKLGVNRRFEAASVLLSQSPYPQLRAS